MKMDRLTSLSLLLLAAFSIDQVSPAMAQDTKMSVNESTSWSNSIQAGDRAFESNKFEEAYALYSQALNAAMKADPPPQIMPGTCGTSWDQEVRRYYKAKGKFFILELKCKQEIAHQCQSYGADNLYQIAFLDRLCEIYLWQNDLSLAEKMLKRAQQVAQQNGDQNTIATRTQLLIKFYQDHKMDDKTPPLFESLFPVKNGGSPQSLHETLARLYQKGREYKRAEPHWQWLLAFGEKTYLDGDCIYCGDNIFKESFVALVDGYINLGDVARAEALCQQKLSHKESLMKSSKYYHPWYGTRALEPMLSKLAECYVLQKKYSQAEDIYQRLLMINERADSDEAIATKEAYARLLNKMQRNSDAQNMSEFLAEVKEDKKRPEPKGTDEAVKRWRLTSEKGRDATRDGKHKKAEQLLSQALKQAELFDPPGDYVSRTLYFLGENCTYDNRPLEAEQYYRRALKNAEKIYGPNHTSLTLYIGGLSSIFWWQRKFSEAMPLYQRSFALKQKEEWPGSPELSTALINLGQCLYMEGKKAEGMKLLDRAVSSKEKWCDDRASARTLEGIGRFFQSQNDTVNATSYLNRAKVHRANSK